MSLGGLEGRARGFNVRSDIRENHNYEPRESNEAVAAVPFALALSAYLAPAQAAWLAFGCAISAITSGCVEEKIKTVYVNGCPEDDAYGYADGEAQLYADGNQVTKPDCKAPPFVPNKNSNAASKEFTDATLFYDDVLITQAEYLALVENTAAALTFAKSFSENYLGVTPPYEDGYKVYYDPCNPVNDGEIYGSSFDDVIALTACSYKNNPETIAFGLAKQSVAAMFYPRLADDPAKIVQTGLESLAALAYLGERGYAVGAGPILLSYSLFDKPVKPALTATVSADNPKVVVLDDLGLPHTIEFQDTMTIDDSEEDSAGYDPMKFEILNYALDGVDGQTYSGRIALTGDNEMFATIETDGVNYTLSFYRKSDVQRVFSMGNPQMLAKCGAEGGKYCKIKATPDNAIYAETGEGNVVLLEGIAYGSHDMQLRANQDAVAATSGEDFLADVWLMRGLAQLYHAAHPENSPNDFYAAFGAVHKKFIASQEGNGEFYNVYHELCGELDIDETLCLGMFKAFGIDTEMISSEEFNYCN